MYFPKGFNAELSFELGELVQQAYAQFDAFENEDGWSLPARYELVGELTYTWRQERPFGKSLANFDSALQRLSRHKTKEPIQIPIGFIARRQRNAYLVLRGTQTTMEWVRNLNIELAPYLLPDCGNVHEGFLQVYKSIRDDMLSRLSAMTDKANLHIAGHSLGAGLATLAALDVESTAGCRVSALYTFGSPRAGDGAFVTAFNAHFRQRSFRIANTSDVVTSVPLPVPIAGIAGDYFSHVDTPVDMTVQKDDLKENHGMKTYLAELRECTPDKGFLGRLFRKAPDEPPRQTT